MTATDDLRRLLDERGEEHYDGTETTLWLKDGVGYRASADEGLNGFIHLRLWCTTPAQAIETTLGRGACRMEHVKDGPCYDVWRCSACGYEYAENVSMDSIVQNFCPNCGREVVE